MSKSLKIVTQMLDDLRALQEKYTALPQLNPIWEEVARLEKMRPEDIDPSVLAALFEEIHHTRGELRAEITMPLCAG